MSEIENEQAPRRDIFADLQYLCNRLRLFICDS